MEKSPKLSTNHKLTQITMWKTPPKNKTFDVCTVSAGPCAPPASLTGRSAAIFRRVVETGDSVGKFYFVLFFQKEIWKIPSRQHVSRNKCNPTPPC